MESSHVLFLALLLLPLVPAGQAQPGGADAWGTLEVEVSGAAGEWVVVRHALPRPDHEVDYRYRLTVDTTPAEGQVPHGLLARPTLLSSGPDGTLRGWLRQEQLEGDRLANGFGWTISGSAWGSSPFQEVVLVFGADAPWTVSFAFTIGDGPTVAPERLTRAPGFAYLEVGGPLGTPQGPAGRLALEAPLRAGLSHLLLDPMMEADAGVRRIHVSFPGQPTFSDVGVAANLVTVGVGVGTWSGAYAMHETGTLQAEVVHADASVGMRIRLASLQGVEGALAGIHLGGVIGFSTFG